MSLWCLLVVCNQDHGAVFGNLDLDGLERVSNARTKYAHARADIELRAMRMADDAGAVAVEVGIFTPCHRCSALMRTRVAISMKCSSSPHHEHCVAACAARIESAGLTID
ncbi:hypothetical protein WK22_17690 [Burkholderia multivorans]|nr:hypothetical protein WK22_17690 [Burkholderia multivorans]